MPSQFRFSLYHGNITSLAVDAIVNAANSGLTGGGGVDGAIHRAAGPELYQACDAIRRSQGGCPTGQAVLTPGFRLPAKWIIHTVGPIWSGKLDHLGQSVDAPLLASCYVQSLQLAQTHQLASIAFPNISTGVYGYPKAPAARVAINAVREWLLRPSPEPAPAIIFVCFDEENLNIYRDLLGR